MCRIASILLLHKQKGSMSGCALYFNNTETRTAMNLFFLKGKAPKEIHTFLIETLGEHAPSYATAQNWVVQVKCGDFSTCHAPRPGRPKRVTTPEIKEKIHELTLEDRPISDKSIAEHLGHLT